MLRCFESLSSFNKILIRMKISGNQKHIFDTFGVFSINHVVYNFPKSKASFCYIQNQPLQQHMFLFKHIILGDLSLSKLQTQIFDYNFAALYYSNHKIFTRVTQAVALQKVCTLTPQNLTFLELVHSCEIVKTYLHYIKEFSST